MASITATLGDPAKRNGKILSIGENGQGKTGSFAALVCAGYNLRVLDTDKGTKLLWALLTDEEHYPYAAYIKKHSIDIDKAVDISQIDLDIELKEVTIPMPGGRTKTELIMAPVNADAWKRMGNMLLRWKDGDSDYGDVRAWGPDTVIGIDSTTTIAKAALYFTQELNGHLGAREVGNAHGRDINEAQSQLTRLMEMLFNKKLGCNVACMGHITMIDTESGYVQAPEQIVRDENQTRRPRPKGYPMMIGRALSPKVGIYFNDLYEYRERKICTTPGDSGAPVKTSLWLEPRYSIETGLAQIMSAHTGRPLPADFMECLAPKGATPSISTSASPPSSSRPGAPAVMRPAPFKP